MKTQTKKYSSQMVKQLMENNRWNFWRKDWSKRIIVQWDNPQKQPLLKFRQGIIKILGKEFIYERAISSDKTQYMVTPKGLVKYKPETATKITFEDHGQDFLEWTIDKNGQILTCAPFQGSIWCRYMVTTKRFKVGGFVSIQKPDQALTIKYAIEKVEKVNVNN